MKKTLIVVGSIPGGGNVGQILLRDMFSCLDAENYLIAALLDPKEKSTWQAQNTQISNDNIFLLTRPPEHADRRWDNRLGGLLSAVERRLVYDAKIRSLINQIEQIIAEEGITRLWAIFNMTTVVDVLFGLMQRCQLPLYSQVWDDIDYLTQQRRLDATMRHRTQKRLGQLLSQSVKTAVICEAMAKEYAQRYGARCEIIRHGVVNKVVAQTEYTSVEEFRIGFAGSMYAPNAWQSLFEALALLNWLVSGKKIKLIVISGKITLTGNCPTNVEYLGRLETIEELRERMAVCDLLYLPSPFASYLKPLAQLSFPTKLSTYVSLGRPIFAHGPAYGSLVDFYEQYPLGALCTSLEPTIIAEKITALAEDLDLYQKSAKTVAWVGENELSHTNFVKQVKRFIESEIITS